MKWLDRILGPDDVFSLEDRNINAVLFCSAFFGSLAFFWDLTVQPETPFVFISASVLASFGILYIIGRQRPFKRILTIPYFFIYAVALILVWFMNGGITGLSLIYIIILLILIPVFVQPQKRTSVFAGILALAIGLFVLELLYPSLAHNLVNKNLQTADTFMSAVFASISAMIFMILVRHGYESQKEKNEIQTKSKDKLYSLIAHDLRGPMSAIRQLGQVLLEQHDELTPKYREEFIRHIYKSSGETHDLLESLLVWGRAETTNAPISAAPINLEDCISKSVAVLAESIRQKNISLTINVRSDHVIYVDEYMIMTVIRNLISNGIKFTSADGRIDISSEKLDDSTIQICISDNGTGIATCRQSSLMADHTVESTKGTNDELGSGLGLSLCKEFVKKNNGTITLESEVDRGTTFYITLPSFPVE